MSFSRFAAFFAFTLMTIASTASRAEEKPVVVASIRPLALVVQALAGDAVETDVLINGANSPHDFALTIAQAMRLSDADLLVWVGPKMESFLRTGVHAKQMLAMDEAVPENAHAGHEHEDVHLWLSQSALEDYVERLAAALIQLLPHEAARLQERKGQFLKQLEIRHQSNRDLLSRHRDKSIAAYHDAYQHLLDAYDVKQVVSLTQVPHERLSAKALTAATLQVEHASCLLSESTELRQAERYARLFEKPLVTVDLLAADPKITSFDAYMEELGLALLSCLAQ